MPAVAMIPSLASTVHDLSDPASDTAARNRVRRLAMRHVLTHATRSVGGAARFTVVS
jgi:hypothetical protein